MAGQKLVPEATPTIGGKIRFPAPKNMEKSMSEATMMVIVGFVLEPVTGLATVSVFVVIIFLVCLNPWDEFLTRR